MSHASRALLQSPVVLYRYLTGNAGREAQAGEGPCPATPDETRPGRSCHSGVTGTMLSPAQVSTGPHC